MKKEYSWTIGRHLILSILITTVSLISNMLGKSTMGLKVLTSILNIIKPLASNDAVSIGIIGGSDGPTSIFVSTTITPFIAIYPQIILFVILILLYPLARIYINRALNRI